MEAPNDTPSNYLTLERPTPPSAIRCDGSWFFATFATLPLFPFFGTLVVIFIYDHCKTVSNEVWPIDGGCGVRTLALTALALIVWCVASLVVCHYAGIMRADRANRNAYASICSEMNAIFAHMCDFWDLLGVTVAEGKGQTQITIRMPQSDEERRKVAAYTDACMQYVRACELLSEGGPHWISGGGYVNVSAALHRAEEALFEFEDKLAVIGDALYDYQRIDSSTINEGKRDCLLAKIHDAACALSPETCRLYWPDAAGSNQKKDGEGEPPQPAEARAPGQPAGQGDGSSESASRATLRVVRRTMNEMRDSIRAQLVGIRAKSIELFTFLGVSVFLLVTAAVLADGHLGRGPSPDVDARITVGPILFFLMGAATGLVYRLYSDSTAGIADNAKGSEDSDLTDVPPELAPLVSGIVAVAGVLMTGGLVGLTAGHTATLSPSIATLFDPTMLAQSLIVAAVFGFAPGLLFDRLAQYTGNLKQDLQSSSAAPKTTPLSK